MVDVGRDAIIKAFDGFGRSSFGLTKSQFALAY